MLKHAAALSVLICLTTWLFISNSYMEYHRVMVEVEDKALRKNAYDQEVPVVIYKNADGSTFEIIATTSYWMAALPGQKRELNLRRFDTHKTVQDEIRYFFVPIFVACITGVYLIMFLSGMNFGSFKLNNGKKT